MWPLDHIRDVNWDLDDRLLVAAHCMEAPDHNDKNGHTVLVDYHCVITYNYCQRVLTVSLTLYRYRRHRKTRHLLH